MALGARDEERRGSDNRFLEIKREPAPDNSDGQKKAQSKFLGRVSWLSIVIDQDNFGLKLGPSVKIWQTEEFKWTLFVFKCLQQLAQTDLRFFKFYLADIDQVCSE